MKISGKTITIYFLWIMAVLFFAWSAYWAPEGSRVSAPEFFLVVLGLAHTVAGIILIGVSFGDDNDWN